jgi:acyl-CoA synthetase (AMP-forming)/AMP-acid ligase II
LPVIDLLNGEFDAGATLEVIEREAITGITLNPPALYELLDHPLCPRRGQSTLARISYGGAPAAPARLREAMEVFGPVLNQSYGLTEAPFITALGPAEHGQARPETLRSCGRPLPTMEVEVRRQDGTVAAPGDVGEIRARGPMVMTGYWGDPARTAQALPGGWLCTGDLGYADPARPGPPGGRRAGAPLRAAGHHAGVPAAVDSARQDRQEGAAGRLRRGADVPMTLLPLITLLPPMTLAAR